MRLSTAIPRRALYFAAWIAELEGVRVEHAIDVARQGAGNIRPADDRPSDRPSATISTSGARCLGLIVAVAVEPGAAASPLARDHDLAGDNVQGAPAKRRIDPRRGTASRNRLTLARRSSPGKRHGGVERRVCRRAGRSRAPAARRARATAGVGAAHLEEALQPHLGEQRGEMIVPIVERRALARERRQLAGEKIAERCPATSI